MWPIVILENEFWDSESFQNILLVCVDRLLYGEISVLALNVVFIHRSEHSV